MNTWMITIAIAAIFIIGGVLVAASLDKPAEVAKTTPTTCAVGNGCAVGGCSAANNCGLSSCGATTGGSCGCGR